jgi:hypothetical protein
MTDAVERLRWLCSPDAERLSDLAAETARNEVDDGAGEFEPRTRDSHDAYRAIVIWWCHAAWRSSSCGGVWRRKSGMVRSSAKSDLSDVASDK